MSIAPDLRQQAMQVDAHPDITSHRAWKKLEELPNVGTVLLAAGVFQDERLAIVTDTGLFVARSIIGTSIKGEMMHEDVAAWKDDIGFFSRKFVVWSKGGSSITLELPGLETPYSVTNAMVHTQLSRRWESRVREVLSPHLATLHRRRSQLLIRDAYGVDDPTKWRKELRKVYLNVFLPSVGRLSAEESEFLSLAFDKFVDGLVAEFADSHKVDSYTGNDPLEFETYCKERLSAVGWSARLTARSGDQGADIIADAKGLRLVLQCKLYSKPVGNAAVQEVIAARTYEQATHAAVVSNADYTPSARALAQRSDVSLLHASELEDYGRELLRRPIGS